METIRGKTCVELDLNGLRKRLADYQRVLLDLGTGDGRYVRYMAERHPDCFVIGVDTCRENLREHSRTHLANVLFVIAGAEDLPHELRGLVSGVTINFPWGSLLDALLSGDAGVMGGLASLACASASLAVRLNGGALAETGHILETGTAAVRASLCGAGWLVGAPRLLDGAALQAFPSTWARRMAHGRDPRAMLIRGSLAGCVSSDR